MDIQFFKKLFGLKSASNDRFEHIFGPPSGPGGQLEALSFTMVHSNVNFIAFYKVATRWSQNCRRSRDEHIIWAAFFLPSEEGVSILIASCQELRGATIHRV